MSPMGVKCASRATISTTVKTLANNRFRKKMNMAIIFRALAAAAFATLGFSVPAHAVVTFDWSAGATCGNGSSVGFTPGGATFQVSLCASTTVERGCGFSAVLKASDTSVAQQNNFSVIALTVGTSHPDRNFAVALPLIISNPPAIADFGATARPSAPTSIAPGANQLLATFTFAPQAAATNATYAIFMSSASEFSIDQGDNTCARPGNSGAPLPVLTLYLGTPPANAPGAPTLNSVSVGPGRTTLSFSPPSNNGGSAISSYTATCVANGQVTRAATGSASPITARGLTVGVVYTCTVTATNSGGLTSGASGAFYVTTGPTANIAPIFILLLN